MNKSALLSFFFGGLLPVIAFTVIEDQYGPLWGTVAGMIFGTAEILFEAIKYRKVSTITWIGNLMILVLGGLSILSQDGIWFKLQPALFEGFFSLILIGSVLVNKPLLPLMAEKQGTEINSLIRPLMTGMTFRLGIFFAIQAALATWAAFSWSTAQWALLKGFGIILSFFIYLGFELLWIRHKVRNR